MGSNDFADLGQAGFIILIGTALSMFSGFLFRVVGARFLSSSSFGAVIVGISVVNLLSTIGLFGLNQGIVKFLSESGEKTRIRSHISFSILIVLLVSVCISILGAVSVDPIKTWFFDKTSSDIFVLIFIVTIPAFSLMKLIGAILRGLMDSISFNIVINVVQPLSKIVLTTIAAVIFGSKILFAIAFLSSVLLTVFVGFYILWSNDWRPNITFGVDNYNLIQFSLPLMISSSVFILLSYFDRLMIGFFLPSRTVATYEIAVTIAGLLAIFRSSFGFLLYPKISEKLSRGEHDSVGELYKQATKWILLFSTPAFAVMVIRPDLLISVFGSQYSPEQISPILAILSVGLFINAVVGPNGEAMLGMGKSRNILIYNVFSVMLNVALNIVLIPIYGLTGAAAASMVGFVAMNALKSADLYLNEDLSVLSIKSILMSVGSFGVATVLLSLPLTLTPPLEFLFLLIVFFLSSIAGAIVLWLNDGFTKADHDLLIQIRKAMNFI